MFICCPGDKLFYEDTNIFLSFYVFKNLAARFYFTFCLNIQDVFFVRGKRFLGHQSFNSFNSFSGTIYSLLISL